MSNSHIYSVFPEQPKLAKLIIDIIEDSELLNCNKVKKILVLMAMYDELPLNMNDLDKSLFGFLDK